MLRRNQSRGEQAFSRAECWMLTSLKGLATTPQASLLFRFTASQNALSHWETAANYWLFGMCMLIYCLLNQGNHNYEDHFDFPHTHLLWNNNQMFTVSFFDHVPPPPPSIWCFNIKCSPYLSCVIYMYFAALILPWYSVQYVLLSVLNPLKL